MFTFSNKTVKEFIETLDSSGGVSKSNKFIFRSYWGFRDSTSGNSKSANTRKIEFLCKSVSIPEISISTFESSNFRPVTKLPYTSINNDFTATFIVTNDMNVRNYFLDWIDNVVGKQQASPELNNSVNYFDDYASQVDITVYSDNGEYARRFLFFDVYPISVGELSLGYDNENTVLEMPVTFTYRIATEYDL